MLKAFMIMHWPLEWFDSFSPWFPLIERPVKKNIAPNIGTERRPVKHILAPMYYLIPNT